MCGLFGYLATNNTPKFDHVRLMKELAYASTIRGMDATGFAWIENQMVKIKKSGVSAFEFDYDQLPAKTPRIMIGHVRASTRGTFKNNHNNHPFLGQLDKKDFALAHNGTLYYDEDLKWYFDLPKTKIQTDSYTIVQLIEKYGMLSLNTLKRVAESLFWFGEFTFTILDDQNNFFVVVGERPFVMCYIPELSLYVYASTKEILLNALSLNEDTSNYLGKTKFKSFEAGDIIQFKNGKLKRSIYELRYENTLF